MTYFANLCLSIKKVLLAICLIAAASIFAEQLNSETQIPLAATVKPQSDLSIALDVMSVDQNSRCVRVDLQSHFKISEIAFSFEKADVIAWHAKDSCEVFWQSEISETSENNIHYFVVSGAETDSFLVTASWQVQSDQFSVVESWPKISLFKARQFTREKLPSSDIHLIRIGESQ